MRFYENPKKVSENREKQRAYYIPENDGAYTLLNGEWNFKYFSRDVDYDGKIENWDKVKVPSCWQTTGYEKPNYTNVAFQFPVDAPYVPDDNPLGVYMREFEIDDTENEKTQHKHNPHVALSADTEIFELLRRNGILCCARKRYGKPRILHTLRSIRI